MRPAELADEGADRLARGGTGAVELVGLDRHPLIAGFAPSRNCRFSAVRRGLIGAIQLEQDDEWAVAERRYFSAESMTRLLTPTAAASEQELLLAMM